MSLSEPSAAASSPLPGTGWCWRSTPPRSSSGAAVRSAAVHQDGVAAARRLARGVVGGDGVLPVAARRLCLCASCRSAAARSRSRSISRYLVIALPDLAAVDRGGLGRAADLAMASGCSACLRSRSGCRSSRSPPTIRCCKLPSSFAPAIPTARSVLPLCLLEHRQFPGAVVLSGAAGADVHAAHPEPDLDWRLRPADRADPQLRSADVRRPWPSPTAAPRTPVLRRRPGYCGGRAGSFWPRSPRPPDRGDRAYLDRRRRGAAVMGAVRCPLYLLRPGCWYSSRARCCRINGCCCSAAAGDCRRDGVSAANRTCC